jgi:phosphoenolpyruvate carboxykinase (ATP)
MAVRSCCNQEARGSNMAAEQFPFSVAGKVHLNSPPVELISTAIRRGEVRLAATGALVAVTGAHTGRSVKDKFTVQDENTDSKTWWDNNYAMSPEHFDVLRRDFVAHAKSLDLYVQDLHVGADPDYRYNTRVMCEYASTLGTQRSSATFCAGRQGMSSTRTGHS